MFQFEPYPPRKSQVGANGAHFGIRAPLQAGAPYIKFRALRRQTEQHVYVILKLLRSFIIEQYALYNNLNRHSKNMQAHTVVVIIGKSGGGDSGAKLSDKFKG